MAKYPPLWLQGGSYPAVSMRQLVAALWPGAAASGGGVTSAGGLVLNVAPGWAAIPAPNGSGAVLCAWDGVETVTLAANPTSSAASRIDRVVCQLRSTETGTPAGGDDFAILPVPGVEATSPNAPAVPNLPNGSAPLARIVVPGGSQSVGAITDDKPVGVRGRVFLDVRSTGTQAVTPGQGQVAVTAPWGAPTENVGGGTWANANGYTIPRPGRYRCTLDGTFSLQVVFDTNGVLTLFAKRFIAGGGSQDFLYAAATTARITQGTSVGVSASRTLGLNAGDRIQPYAFLAYYPSSTLSGLSLTIEELPQIG